MNLALTAKRLAQWLGWESETDQSSSPSKDQLHLAALSVLYRQWSDVQVFVSEVAGGRKGQKEIDRAQALCDHWREWADGLTDKATASAYLGWVKHFEISIRKAREELRTGKEKRSREEYARERAAEEASTAEAVKVIPQPPRFAK